MAFWVRSRSRLQISKNIPDDVWRLIFRELVDNNDGLPTSTNSIKMVIKLSQVCPQFRWVAIHQSELWNNIPVNIIIDDYQAIFLDEEIVALALQRASQLPLTLSLRVDSRIMKRGTGFCPGFTGVLTFLKSIHRAKALSIDHTAIRVCGQYTTLINTLCAHGAPFLEDLLYYGPQSEVMGSIGAVLSEFSKASTKLKTLKIFREQGTYVSWTRFNFDFNQLLDLEIGGPITFQALVAILSSTKSLLTCVIHEVWDGERSDADCQNGIISLPFLVKFVIRGSRPTSYNSVPQVLSLINAPSLNELSLAEYDWRPSDMLVFVRTSHFVLRHLSFEGVIISSSEMLDFLDFLPSLERLAFDTFFPMHSNITFASRMMAWDTTGKIFQLCPQLMVLEIFYTYRYDYFHPLSPTPISEMVEKRLRGLGGVAANLKEVRIVQFNPSMLSVRGEGSLDEINEITRLLALKKDGLNIIFDLGCQ